jgi:hypothetical protein
MATISLRPDDGGSRYIWNVSQFLVDYTTQHSRRQTSSYSSLCEPEISQIAYDILLYHSRSGLYMCQVIVHKYHLSRLSSTSVTPYYWTNCHIRTTQAVVTTQRIIPVLIAVICLSARSHGRPVCGLHHTPIAVTFLQVMPSTFDSDLSLHLKHSIASVTVGDIALYPFNSTVICPVYDISVKLSS